MASWTVSIEAVGSSSPAADVAQLTSALERLGDLVAQADGHYTVEMLMPGAQPADAVKAAMWVWREAVAEAGLPDWPVVRVDVQPLVPASAKRRTARRPA
jgi:hypothetical protein